jgi:hypothetical protein
MCVRLVQKHTWVVNAANDVQTECKNSAAQKPCPNLSMRSGTPLPPD